jgi:hypothetical protein
MKFTPPWRKSVTFLLRCFATAVKPIRTNSAPSATGSGAAYSMNSNPSVPSGFSQRSVRIGFPVRLARPDPEDGRHAWRN